MEIRPLNLNRDEIAAFAKSPKTIRELETLNVNQDQIVTTLTAVLSSPLLATSLSPVFAADRALAGSSDILLTDGGPKSNVTLSLAPSGVSASTYGGATKAIAFAVDAKGRLTLAAEYSLVSDNVSEGTANLYFTSARARAAVSATAGLSYDEPTGVFSLAVPTASGVYTPTLTAGANISAATPFPTQYIRVGNVVTVSGRVRIDITLDATNSIVDILLPIASNFSNAYECAGTAASSNTSNTSAVIFGEAASDVARLQFLSSQTGVRDYYFTFTYRILP